MTCYLILDFRPTYFSYFQKITAISHSHNVKKEVDPKLAFPVVKGLTQLLMTSHKKKILKEKTNKLIYLVNINEFPRLTLSYLATFNVYARSGTMETWI